MTVGTGIFLSAIFLGLIALFIATKDRWKWKKIVLWLVGTTVLVVFAFVGWAAYEDRPSPPEKITELWGLRLGMGPDEVRFRKGKPTWAVVDQGKLANANWFFDVHNDGYSTAYTVTFKDNKISHISYRGPSYEAPSIPGINIGESQEQLVEALGDPSSVTNSKDSLDRLAHFEKYNLIAELTRNEVVGYGIYNPSAGTLNFRFEFVENPEKTPGEKNKSGSIVPLNDLPNELIVPAKQRAEIVWDEAPEIQSAPK